MLPFASREVRAKIVRYSLSHVAVAVSVLGSTTDTQAAEQVAATIGGHARIIAAIQSQDQKAAAALAASEHVSLLGDDMTDFIARLPSFPKAVQ